MALCGELALEPPMDRSLDRKHFESTKVVLEHCVPEDKFLILCHSEAYFDLEKV